MTIEIEAKFGKFSNKRFNPELSPQQYNDIYHFLLNNYGKPVVRDQIIEVYGDVKKITENGKASYMMKKLIKNDDNSEYGLRVSTSEETVINDFDTKGKKITFSEIRSRATFLAEKLKLKFDLNTFTDGRYTAEIEQLSGCDNNVFNDMITFLLQIIQESEVLITNTEKNEVIAKYKKITKKKNFSGVQPVTISSSKLKKNADYVITKKLDGRRFLLMTYLNNVYAISTKLTVRKLPFVNKYMDDLIFDSEYFREAYHIFDLIQEAPFDERMKKIQEIYKRFEPYKNTKIHIYIKKYEHSEDFAELFKKLSVGLDEKVYDGLIVLNKKQTYSKSSPFKWKPAHMNTVDFKIKKKDGKTFELYVTNKKGLELFAETDVSAKDYNLYADDSVVEFKFDNKWIPMRIRFDKENPNFITVAEDNLNATMYPFEPATKSHALGDMRRYHNYIKRFIINKYKPKSYGSVLDVACGKGGDLHKYINSNFNYIEGYDINEDSIKEAKRRASEAMNSNKNKNLEIVLKVQDLNKTPINSSRKFDMVVCNFAFHYLYKKMDLFLKNVMNNTKSGSIITLSFFNNSLLKNIKTETYEIKKTGTSKVCVWIKDSVLNKKETEDIVDLPVMIEYFLSNGLVLLDNMNFSELYKDWQSKDSSNMLSEDERNLSFMNNVLVFMKN